MNIIILMNRVYTPTDVHDQTVPRSRYIAPSIFVMPDTSNQLPFWHSLAAPGISSRDSISYNLVDSLTPIETDDTKQDQPGSGSPKPIEIIDILARDFEIAAKHSRNNIHGKNYRSKHGQPAQHIRGL